jgi:membrane protease YdiL (CAAX protease family)
MILQASGVGEFVKSISDNTLLKNAIILLLYLLQVAGMLFPLWYFVLRKYTSDYEEFAFRWIGTRKTFLWIIMSYLFYLGLSIFLIEIFYNLGIESFGFEKQRSLFEIFGTDIVGVLFAIFVAIIIAPIVEEIFFRGFILQTLVKRISAFWGVVLTALIFAAVHFEFRSIMPLLILSFILNIIFVKTRSIWPCIIFHIFNNTVTFIGLYCIETGYWLS